MAAAMETLKILAGYGSGTLPRSLSPLSTPATERVKTWFHGYRRVPYGKSSPFAKALCGLNAAWVQGPPAPPGFSVFLTACRLAASLGGRCRVTQAAAPTPECPHDARCVRTTRPCVTA